MEGLEPNGVIAVFPDRDAIELAIDWLKVDGVDGTNVSILAPRSIQELPPELDRSPAHVGEVGSYWAKWGAALGALAGAGPASIAIAAAAVGMGPMAAVVAAGLGTAAATATAGAIAAGLIGAGLHERHARTYERALRDGKFVLVVHSDDPATLRSARDEFERMEAESVECHGITGRADRQSQP